MTTLYPETVTRLMTQKEEILSGMVLMEQVIQ